MLLPRPTVQTYYHTPLRHTASLQGRPGCPRHAPVGQGGQISEGQWAEPLRSSLCRRCTRPLGRAASALLEVVLETILDPLPRTGPCPLCTRARKKGLQSRGSCVPPGPSSGQGAAEAPSLPVSTTAADYSPHLTGEKNEFGMAELGPDPKSVLNTSLDHLSQVCCNKYVRYTS